MTGRRFVLGVALVLTCGIVMGTASGATRPRHAIEAPGVVEAVSCAGVGDCAAGGYYLRGTTPYLSEGSYHQYGQSYVREAFVANETNGRWGKPVPGRSLSIASGSEVDAISCAAPGDCAAAVDSYLVGLAFLVSETHGKWGKAVPVTGLAMPRRGGYAHVSSISCVAPGDCAAGGYYTDARYDEHAFVVSETHGVWRKAIDVPGTAAFHARDVAVTSISCAAPGECAVGGSYSHGSATQAFVADETNGTWGTAIEVPGTAALNAGGDDHLDSISCAAAGECAASGFYADGLRTYQAFVVDETSHTWGSAIEVPGMASLNTGVDASADTISCSAVGDCAAGGYFSEAGGHERAFVAAETNGTWGAALEVPGLGAFSREANVDSISCAAPGECAAGGDYKDPRATNGGRYGSAFVVSETSGTWGQAITVPGTASLNGSSPGSPAASADSISCAAAGECAAGGYWITGSAQLQPRKRRPRTFVLDEKNGVWGAPIRIRNHLTSCAVPSVLDRTVSEAKWRLVGFGCHLGRVSTAPSSVPKGLVIAQHPSLGTKLKAGARVAVTISAG